MNTSYGSGGIVEPDQTFPDYLRSAPTPSIIPTLRGESIVTGLGLPGKVIRDRLELLTPLDLAHAFQVTQETLATWRSKNFGPSFIKLGKSIFYRFEDVERWVRMFPSAGKLRKGDLKGESPLTVKKPAVVLQAPE